MKQYREEQIKFRVWNDINKVFITPNGENNKDQPDYMLSFSGELIYGDNMGAYVVSDYEDYQVQLFTGYLDKNKKEIYEGDIVKYAKGDVVNDLFFTDGQKEYDAAEIRYLNGGFHLCQKYLGRTPLEDFLTCSCCPCSLEIIGNVLETPEQLNIPKLQIVTGKTDSSTCKIMAKPPKYKQIQYSHLFHEWTEEHSINEWDIRFWVVIYQPKGDKFKILSYLYDEEFKPKILSKDNFIALVNKTIKEDEEIGNLIKETLY